MSSETEYGAVVSAAPTSVKVAVAALYLAQVDHGRRSLDDTINGQSARSLMKRMLVHSDNRAEFPSQHCRLIFAGVIYDDDFSSNTHRLLERI